MSESSKYNITTDTNQIIETNSGTVIGKQVQAQNSSEAALDAIDQIIRTLEQKYTFVQDEQQARHIIDAEFTEIKAKQLPQWQDLMNLKRLYNGSKKAALKIGEHFAEQNLFGKVIIAALEGVSEDVK